MGLFELLAIIVLIALAAGNLFVGVANDAVNFLNSAIAAKASSRKVILLVAGVGVLIGATFSDGIIEVARKGIFHPEFFTATEVIIFLCKIILWFVPEKIRTWTAKRWVYTPDNEAAFDLIRASLNLMLSAALISYATFHKLPLSTTYVTFMVAMGTALADGAWDRECAPARITGVLTVISGWFMTAFFAFLIAGVMVAILHFANIYGLIGAVSIVIFLMYKLFHIHDKRYKRKKASGAKAW